MFCSPSETSIIEKEEANETLWNITGSPSKTSIVSEEANETVWNITGKVYVFRWRIILYLLLKKC